MVWYMWKGSARCQLAALAPVEEDVWNEDVRKQDVRREDVRKEDVWKEDVWNEEVVKEDLVEGMSEGTISMAETVVPTLILGQLGARALDLHTTVAPSSKSFSSRRVISHLRDAKMDKNNSSTAPCQPPSAHPGSMDQVL